MKKDITIVYVVVIMIILLSACGSVQISDIATANGTMQALIETVKPGKLNSSINKEEKVAKIMEQVDLFLKAEEPYSEEDMEWKMFRYDSWKGDIELGILMAIQNSPGGIVSIQGALLGYVEEPDGVVLLIGFQDKNGNRFVSPLKIYDEIINTQGLVYVYSPKNLHVPSGSITPHYRDRESIVRIIEERVGTVLSFQVSLKEPPEYSNEIEKSLLNNGVSDPETYYKIKAGITMKTLQKTQDLVLSLWCPSTGNLGYTGNENALASYGHPSSEPMKITTIEDIFSLESTEMILPKADVVFSQK